MSGPIDPATDLSVVVPTRDRPDFLASCLDALAQLDVPPVEVLVVDSASTDPAAARASASHVAVLRCELPGASRARNAGWRAARGRIVAFVDDDVRVAADWSSRICAPFAEDDVAFVTGAVRAGRPVPGAGAHVAPVAVTDDVPAGPFDRTTSGNVGASANLAVRRDALAAVGGFDEAMGAGARFRAAEDIDLFRRLFEHGRGWHAADAVGHHDQWRGRRALVGLDADYGFGCGVHLAKVVRTDRARGWQLAAYELRRYGRDVVRTVRSRHRLGFLRRTVWLVWAVAGVARGLAVPIHDGHLRPRDGVRRGR